MHRPVGWRAAFAAALSAAAVLAGCSGSGTTHAARTATTTTTPPTTVAPTTTTAGSSVVAVGTLGVGTRTDTYVDSSRPTPPNGGAPGAPNRSMATSIWYPAAAPAGTAVSNATPDLSHGPYPLVLFAHGFAVTPLTYAALLTRWASAGYVVVAPALPLLNGNAPGGASHGDYGQPNLTDLSFVITEALRRAGTPGDPLAGLVNSQAVAVTGHSDGEALAYDLAFSACCHDQRVRAVIPMAGNLANALELPGPTGVPVLHVMDDHDQYDPYPASIAWDRQYLRAPRYLLTLVSANHLPPFSQPSDPHFDLVTQATVDFLDGTLKHRPDGFAALAALPAGSPSLATLEAQAG
jgi:dienelactone hydrolase